MFSGKFIENFKISKIKFEEISKFKSEVKMSPKNVQNIPRFLPQASFHKLLQSAPSKHKKTK